jgi:hypothetical protein
MAQTRPRFANVLGLDAAGDLGGFTAYTSKKNRVVWFVKSPPLTPPSYHQRVMRNRFRTIALSWTALAADRRQAWLRAARSAGLRIGGYPLYVWYQTTKNPGPIRTIERLSHEVLL